MSRAGIRLRMLVLGVACAGLGAGAGAIASATANPTTPAHHARHGRWHRDFPRRFGARAVHGDIVVYTRNGYQTVTFDRGFVDSVQGQDLTMTDGTPAHPYRTVTITVPSNARVRNNGHIATLSSLAAGERVVVLQGPARFQVLAHTPRHGRHRGA